jgi:hypothetical protein
MAPDISDDELCADLRSLADELGASPTVREYRDQGTYSPSTLRSRFGSWNEAIKAAGLDNTHSKRPIPEAQLLEELQTLADDLGEPPTAQQMDDHGPRWRSVYQDRFGSWNDALEAADLATHEATSTEASDTTNSKAAATTTASEDDQPSDAETAPADTAQRGRIDTDTILESLRAVADELDQPPTAKQFDERGICSSGTVYNRFGTWNDALEAAGLDPDAPRGATTARQPRIPDGELLADIRRLADDDGTAPTLQEYRDHGEYGAQTIYSRFGSWNEAVEAAEFEAREPNTAVSDADLIAELQRLAADDGSLPTTATMRTEGEYWVSTYRDHFGSWQEALAAAGFET